MCVLVVGGDAYVAGSSKDFVSTFTSGGGRRRVIGIQGGWYIWSMWWHTTSRAVVAMNTAPPLRAPPYPRRGSVVSTPLGKDQEMCGAQQAFAGGGHFVLREPACENAQLTCGREMPIFKYLASTETATAAVWAVKRLCVPGISRSTTTDALKSTFRCCGVSCYLKCAVSTLCDISPGPQHNTEVWSSQHIRLTAKKSVIFSGRWKYRADLTMSVVAALDGPRSAP